MSSGPIAAASRVRRLWKIPTRRRSRIRCRWASPQPRSVTSSSRLPRRLRVLVCSARAALLDEGAGAFEFLFVAEEAGAVKVDVGQVQPHRDALGNLPGFAEVRPRQVRLALHGPQPRAVVNDQ